MKRFLFVPCLALATFLGILTARSQNSTAGDYLVVKGKVFSQASTAAPTPQTANGAAFLAQAPGVAGFTTSATLTIPGGGSRTLAASGTQGIFQYTDAANTVAALDAIYPAGNYVFTESFAGFPITATVALPADAFPAPPQIVNFAQAQTVDSTQDFVLVFQPFANPGTDDEASFEIYQNGTEIYSDTGVSTSATNYTIAAGTLAGAATYQGRLRFEHVQTGAAGSGGTSAYGFYSETWFPIVTSGGGDVTPPALISATPTNGALMPALNEPLLLSFNKGMIASDIAIQWSATLNGAAIPLAASNFVYTWTTSSNLLCQFSPLGSGWPAGSLVTWALNPTSGAPSNFADSGGIPLASGTYSGSFYSAGGPWACVAQINQPLQAPAFYVAKVVNYLQNSGATPVVNPQLGAELVASLLLPMTNGALGGGGGAFPIVLLAPPGGNSFGAGVNVLQAGELVNNGLIELDYTFSQSFPSGAALDAAFPGGKYALELALPNTGNQQSPLIVTNSASLVVTNGLYPPVPQFSNATALPASALTNGFVVHWNAYAGADPTLSFIQFEVLDANSNVVISAPNACAGTALAVSATSFSIPAGALSSPGGPYTLALAFGRLSDSAEVMPGVPGQGYAAIESTTRMPVLSYLSSHPLPPPPTVAITSPPAGSYVTAGQVSFQVSAAQPNGSLTQLQLFSGTNLVTTLPVSPGQTNFAGAITGTLAPGAQRITVVAVDNNGQSATAGPLAIFAQSPSFQVSLTSPVNASIFPPFASLHLAASASSPSGAITNVVFFADGSPLGGAISAPYTLTVPQAGPGSHQIYALAFDNAGFSGVSPAISVTIQTPPTNRPTPFFSTNGLFSIGFSSSAIGGYVLEATTNLANPADWTPIQTESLSSTQTVFSDGATGHLPSRYYKIVPLTSLITNAPAFSVWDQPNPAVSGSDNYNWNSGAVPSLTNANGTVYTLAVPPGAMNLGQKVSLTLVTNIQNYPLSGTLMGAVDITPSEFYLFIPGTLTIQLPPGVTSTQVVAFTYHQPNGELFLTPFQTTNIVTATSTNQAVVIPVRRLGGYGLAMAQTADLTLASQFPPSAPADFLDQITAIALNPQSAGLLSLGRGARSNPARPQASQAALQQQFLDQFTDIIYPQMQAAAAGAGWSCQEWASWLAWRRNVFSLGLDDVVALQIGQFQTTLIAVVQTEVNKKISDANEQHDWPDIVWLSNFDASGMIIAQFLYIPGSAWPPGAQQALQQALDNCLTFEFDMDSSTEISGDGLDAQSEIKVAITFSQGNPSTLQGTKGSAAPTWVQTTLTGKCGEGTASPTTPSFLAFGFTPTSTGSQGSCFGDSSSISVNGLTMSFWTANPQEDWTMYCQGWAVPVQEAWMAAFGYFHLDDLGAFPSNPNQGPPQASFNISDGWVTGDGNGNEVLGSLTVSNSGSFQSGTATENTTFKLKHTPQ